MEAKKCFEKLSSDNEQVNLKEYQAAIGSLIRFQSEPDQICWELWANLCPTLVKSTG